MEAIPEPGGFPVRDDGQGREEIPPRHVVGVILDDEEVERIARLSTRVGDQVVNVNALRSHALAPFAIRAIFRTLASQSAVADSIRPAALALRAAARIASRQPGWSRS